MRPKKHEMTGSGEFVPSAARANHQQKHELVGRGATPHAKQFNRHRRELRILRTRLGRIIRDIQRQIVGEAELEAVFAWPLSWAAQIRSQQQRQRGWKLCAASSAPLSASYDADPPSKPSSVT